MAAMLEQARELGRALAHTEEHQALRRAIKDAGEDSDILETRNLLVSLEQELSSQIRAGEQPDTEKAEAYEAAAVKLQGFPVYQRLVSAQENFDKIMHKVNEAITKGMEDAGESRIILPT